MIIASNCHENFRTKIIFNHNFQKIGEISKSVSIIINSLNIFGQVQKQYKRLD